MKICRDRKNRNLTLSQVDYITKVLQCFSMENAKAVSTPLPSHLKLTKEMCPKTKEEEDRMSKVPYASAIGSLMYAMVCNRPDIAHVVGVVSRYMSHPRIEHWNAVKWILRYLRGTSSKCLHFGALLLIYRDMLTRIWQGILIIGGVLQVMYLMLVGQQ